MSFEKYLVLVWKNWTIQKRHYISAIIEVILPVLIVILFTWLRSSFRHENEQLYLSNYTFPEFSYCHAWDEQITKIVYSPKSVWTDEFLETVFKDTIDEYESFDNAQTLDGFLEVKQPRNVLGIEFDDSLNVINEKTN